MNKILTVIAIVILVSGCSPMQTITPAERHQAAKTKYYENLNQSHLNALEEVDAKSVRAPVER